MSDISEIHTENAPALEEFPFSQAVKHGETIYVSGAVALDPETEEFVGGGVKRQTRQILDNISAILDAAGSSFDQVVKTTVFLEDIDDFASMNEIYAEYVSDPLPARSAFEVGALAGEYSVEIEVIAGA